MLGVVGSGLMGGERRESGKPTHEEGRRRIFREGQVFGHPPSNGCHLAIRVA